MFGDFNLPEIDYDTFGVEGEVSSCPVRFFDLTQDLFLIQYDFEFNRVHQGQKSSKLDYVLTMMNEHEVERLSYLSPLGLSDHDGIQWKLNCRDKSTNQNKESRYAYWKADYNEMR